MTAYLQPGDHIHLAIPGSETNEQDRANAKAHEAIYAAQGVTIAHWEVVEADIAPIVVAVFRAPTEHTFRYRWSNSDIINIPYVTADDAKIQSAGEKEEQAAPDLGPSRRAHGEDGPKIQTPRKPAQRGPVHIGRAWSGCELETACPCPQEPCGLISDDRIVLGCPEHGPRANKTIRRSHPADSTRCTEYAAERVQAGAVNTPEQPR